MQTFYTLLGHLCLTLGVIGAFLPLMPTTVFILLAAYFYSKGSERFHRWLIRHPRFGHILSDWHQHRAIRPRAKVTATILIAASFSYLLVFRDHHWGLKLGLATFAVALISFILTRASGPEEAAVPLRVEAPCGEPDDPS